MPTKTTNLNLNIFLESDIVNFEEINDNFRTIDGLKNCYESGVLTAPYSGKVSGSLGWRYNKYTDNTIEMRAKLDISTISFDESDPTITFDLPVPLTDIYSSVPSVTSDETTLATCFNVSPKGAVLNQKVLIKRTGTAGNPSIVLYLVVKGTL